MNPKLFQVAILWHPTEKQKKDDGAKSVIVLPPKFILATDAQNALMAGAMEIPADKREQLDQVEVVVKAF